MMDRRIEILADLNLETTWWSFVIVNSGPFLINAVTPGTWWFQWPFIGLGIGLAFNFRAACIPASSCRGHR